MGGDELKNLHTTLLFFSLDMTLASIEGKEKPAKMNSRLMRLSMWLKIEI